MLSGPLHLYDSALAGLMNATLPLLAGGSVSATLLAPTYAADYGSHSVFADVAAHELPAMPALRQRLTGSRTEGASFLSDDISFGDPVTLGPARYLLLGFADGAGLLTGTSKLLGVMDLSPTGGALEAQRSHFTVTAPAGGWFTLQRAAA